MTSDYKKRLSQKSLIVIASNRLGRSQEKIGMTSLKMHLQFIYYKEVIVRLANSRFVAFLRQWQVESLPPRGVSVIARAARSIFIIQ
jgi:hypothetical protein